LIIQDINPINGRGNFSETRLHGILCPKQGKQERQNRINAPSPQKKRFNAFIDFNFILELSIFIKMQFLFILSTHFILCPYVMRKRRDRGS
jgi:hypothetical protein